MLHLVRTTSPTWWATALLVAVLIPALAHPAIAQTYSRLQVLVPGEIPAPGTASGKQGTPNPQTVGDAFTIRVRACDSSWNTVASVTSLIAVTSSDASADLPGQTMLLQGEIQLPVTLNADGVFTFSATDESDLTIPEATSATVTATALQGFEFTRINQKNQYAGQSMAITLYAVDAVGNTVNGFSGLVRLSEITSFGEGRISPELVTLSGGTWSGNVTLYRADETAINRGNVNIYAKLDSDPSKNGTSDPFSVHPGPFSRIQIVLPGQDPLPGSVSGVEGDPATQAATELFSVDVYAADGFWNPVPSSDVVRITSSDPAASTPVSGALAGGYAAFQISLGTVGTQTLTVTDQTNGSITGMTSVDIQVIASSAQQFVIDPVNGPLTAGSPVSVTVRAADLAGNTIPDFSGDAIFSANTGPGSTSPEAITFTNGVWTGNMVFRGAGGAVSFTCSDFSSPPHTGTSNNFTVIPGPFTGLQVLLPGESPQGGTQDGVTGMPEDQNAGSSFNLTVRAVDNYWNVVPGVTDLVGLSSTDLFAGMPAETTLVNGSLTFPVTLYRAGHQTITATDLDGGSISPHTSSSVQVLPGTYSRVLILAPGEAPAPGTAEGRTGMATDQSINYAFTVNIHATDNWWNPIGGTSDLIRITSNDPLAELPPDTPLMDGRADLSIRLSTGGFQQITVENLSQPGMPTSTTQVRAISSGFHLEAEVVPTTVQAGEPFTLTVKVTNDAGSVIQEINSSVTVAVQHASTQAPGQGVLETTQFQLLQGQRSVSETYTFTEPIVLMITDDAGNEPAVTETITILPGDPFKVQLSGNPSWVGGNRHATVNARVVDAFENGVPDQAVVFQLLSGAGTLTPIEPITDPTGLATADFLSPREPEVGRIRATSGVLSAEMDLETAFVNPNAAGGSVTNYPNPFHPSEAPTTIAYVLADNASVTLQIYTLSGNLVVKRQFPLGAEGGRAGLNEYPWNGRNGQGELVASGGYILVINAEGTGETLHVMRRKIAVVR